MILIGSRALMIRAGGILNRKPADFDFICTNQEFDEWLSRNRRKIGSCKIYAEDTKFNKMIVESNITDSRSHCEFEIVEPFKSSELIDNYVKNDPDTIETEFGLVPSLNVLFMLKASHRYLKDSPWFWKTLNDYHIMKRAGAKIKGYPALEEILKKREKETYTYLHPKLNQSKNSFFCSYV